MKIRYASISILFILILAGLIFVVSPLWVPIVGGVFAQNRGLQWDSSKATGFSTFTLEKIRFSSPAVRITVDELVVPQPLPWLSGLFLSGHLKPIEGGTLRIVIRENKSEKQKAENPVEVLSRLQAQLRTFLPYAPSIQFGRIELQSESGDVHAVIHDFLAKDFALKGILTIPEHLPNAEFRAFLGNPVSTLVARGLEDGGKLFLAAEFRNGAKGPAFTVNASLPLERIASQWDTNGQAKIRLSGGVNVLEIQSLEAEASWFSASLSNPVRFSFKTHSFTSAARLTFAMQLEGQQLVSARGLVEGEVNILQPGQNPTDLEFSVKGSRLFFSEVPLLEISCRGSLDYPLLSLSEARLVLDENSPVSLSGIVDLKGLSAEGNAVFSISPEWIENLRSPVALQESFSGNVEFSGPLNNLAHSGNLHPFSIHLEGAPSLTTQWDWQGTGLHSIAVKGRLESDRGGRLEIVAKGERSTEGDSLRLEVDEVVLGGSGLSDYHLVSPFNTSLRLDDGIRIESISEVHFRSEEGTIYCHYKPDTGAILLEGKHLDLTLFEPWSLKEFPPAVIDLYSISLKALDPYLEATFDISLHGKEPPLETLILRTSGSIDGSGIRLGLLEGFNKGSIFCKGAGVLPIRLHPSRNPDSGFYSWISGGTLSGNLAADIPESLLGDFGQITYLGFFQGSRLEINIGGSLESPTAILEMDIPQLDLEGHFLEELQGLLIEDIHLALELSPERLELQDMQAAIREGKISLKGYIPTQNLKELANSGWKTPQSLLDQIFVEASLQNFEIAQFRDLLPGWLKSKGSLEGKIRMQPGVDVSGELTLKGAGLRPTLYSKPLEIIQVGLKVKDTRLHLHNSSVRLGDSLVSLSGYYDINDFKSPVFSIQLTGQRSPLVRTTDLLLLADIDLSLDQIYPQEPATLSGTIELRDGVLLMDVDPLGAKTSGNAVPRPPFFSIETSPYASWNLDIDITGEEAARFRSKYVNSLLSINANLGGTLENPVWVGEVRANDGRIAFPGTRMSVSSGEFFITREQQDLIQLDIQSIGKAASYIVSMGIKGSLEDPQVSFASTPALTNAQIFQLLATGSLDNSGIGTLGLYFGRGMLRTGGDGILERLSLEVGRDISETGSNTIDLFYELNERWRVHGEYDKYDAQNINLEWEVFSK